MSDLDDTELIDWLRELGEEWLADGLTSGHRLYDAADRIKEAALYREALKRLAGLAGAVSRATWRLPQGAVDSAVRLAVAEMDYALEGARKLRGHP